MSPRSLTHNSLLKFKAMLSTVMARPSACRTGPSLLRGVDLAQHFAGAKVPQATGGKVTLVSAIAEGTETAHVTYLFDYEGGRYRGSMRVQRVSGVWKADE